MFSLLHNINASLAPPHSTLCARVVGDTCVSEKTTLDQEAQMIAGSVSSTGAFATNLFKSDKVCSRQPPTLRCPPPQRECGRAAPTDFKEQLCTQPLSALSG